MARTKGAKDLSPRKKRALKTYDGQLKHEHFMAVEFYMRGFSKTEALVKAGYSETTARDQAYRVFGRTDVQREIEHRRRKVRTRSHEMIDRIQEELANIAFFNIGHILEVTDDGHMIFDFTDATMEEFSAIGEVTVEEYTEGKGAFAQKVKRVKVKPYDKKAALDSLARIHGMFQDNLALSSGESLEERLAAGRKRVSQGAVVEGEVVSHDTENES